MLQKVLSENFDKNFLMYQEILSSQKPLLYQRFSDEHYFFVTYPLIQLTLPLLRFFLNYEFCGKVENPSTRNEFQVLFDLQN